MVSFDFLAQEVIDKKIEDKWIQKKHIFSSKI